MRYRLVVRDGERGFLGNIPMEIHSIDDLLICRLRGDNHYDDLATHDMLMHLSTALDNKRVMVVSKDIEFMDLIEEEEEE